MQHLWSTHVVQLEVHVDDHSRATTINRVASSEEGRNPAWINSFTLVIWLLAGAVAFIPFARDTSPWDAVTLNVPGNQGNWWHVLVGVPFFLAYPMIWLRLRPLFSTRLSTPVERRFVWGAVACSIAGTTLVQVPFLLHLAGTSEWQRLFVLSLGFGIMMASAIALLLLRHQILPTRACLVGVDTAYLANAALCLVVYREATGTLWSRSGWFVSLVIIWPIFLELIWLFIQTARAKSRETNLALQ
jgi:hypothetical protein